MVGYLKVFGITILDLILSLLIANFISVHFDVNFNTCLMCTFFVEVEFFFITLILYITQMFSNFTNDNKESKQKVERIDE